MKNTVLDQLKSLISKKTDREVLPFRLLDCGIPKGAITEISGHGKTQFVLSFLTEHKDLKVAWIEKNFSVNPFGFLQNQVELNRIVFIEANEDLEWSIYQTLRTQSLEVVVIYAEDIPLRTLRRIQLQSEKAQAVTFWLTNKPKDAWPVSLRLNVSRQDQEIKADVLKQRI